MDILLRHEHNQYTSECSVWLICLWSILLFSACSPQHKDKADRLNEISYAYHYRNLDSTEVYARKAYAMSDGYDAGKAEALNNLAFVSMAKMDYPMAARQLDSAITITDNQVELMIAETQYMRLCQRQSHNKAFYDHQEKAKQYLQRILEEQLQLDNHLSARFIYAESEFYLNASAYYYYVGLAEPSVAMIEKIEPNGDILKDTAQYLGYLYNVGAGGIVSGDNASAIAKEEFDYLTRCYIMAVQSDYPYWKAQAMQAISEHLMPEATRNMLLEDYGPFLDFLNTDRVDLSLLSGNLAERSLEIFRIYGDVYQTAGAFRTLASCFWEINDYHSAMICLNNALETDTVINHAPDLVASIREQLCLVYSAQNDKLNSDRNRNHYLDLQEQTRQDKQLEARAEQLEQSARSLNIMILAIILIIAFVLYMLFFFTRKRKRNGMDVDMESLLEPLRLWKEENDRKITEIDEKLEELHERISLTQLTVEKNKHRNLEQRAKLSLVNSITPFIDRIINEVGRLKNSNESPEIKQERYNYVTELTDVINDYNSVLTRWIQMQQGSVRLRIESFHLNDLFNVVSKAKMGFTLRGINLEVIPTTAIVKADRILTLFMINTIAENARKFTPEGGEVKITATEEDNFVEIGIEDNGKGMDEYTLEHIFDTKPVNDDGTEKITSHGFGLLNCKGIIENYKKISKIFSVCEIYAKSIPGKGSRFAFRLPKGIARTFILLAFLLPFCHSYLSAKSKGRLATTHTILEADEHLKDAARFADSAYFCNINGKYWQTVVFADSCLRSLNMHYGCMRTDKKGRGADTLVLFSTSAALPAEISWFHKQMKTEYPLILDIRNETAVAALALHDWELYRYNNKVYTRLFHEYYADVSLPQYVRTMQRSESNKGVAIVILILLLTSIPPIYYIVYYRHVLYYRGCVERINNINNMLLGNSPDETKLRYVEEYNSKKSRSGIPVIDDIVSQIVTSMRMYYEAETTKTDELELAADHLRRVERDGNMLYISNSVLDNCLSALKHETMYFPSRIKNLINGKDTDIEPLAEVVAYYKQLYTMLSTQAQRQVDAPFRVDKETMDYLFEILKKMNGGTMPEIQTHYKDNIYAVVQCKMSALCLDSEQQQQLFTPLTIDTNYLVCRQIIRELGEQTNSRGCGILAKENNIIEITIPIRTWKTLIS